MCGFCNVWVCVCVGFVMCGCFDSCVDVIIIVIIIIILRLLSGYIIKKSTVQSYTEEYIFLMRLSIHQIGTVQ